MSTLVPPHRRLSCCAPRVLAISGTMLWVSPWTTRSHVGLMSILAPAWRSHVAKIQREGSGLERPTRSVNLVAPPQRPAREHLPNCHCQVPFWCTHAQLTHSLYPYGRVRSGAFQYGAVIHLRYDPHLYRTGAYQYILSYGCCSVELVPFVRGEYR